MNAMEADIRWKQRFASYTKALGQLRAAVAIEKKRALSDLERQGLIKSFEFTHELAWNLLKDILQWQGVTGLLGSRDATRRAFSVGLIADGERWMEMIASRNQTAHTYDEETARDIAEKVSGSYLSLFEDLKQTVRELADAD